MGRRKFSREFKLEAVRLVRDWGVAVLHARRDLHLAESVLRRWMRKLDGDAAQAFPANGQMKPEQLEITRLRKEVAWGKGRDLRGSLRAVLPELDAATRTRTALFEVTGDQPPAWRSVGALVLTDRVTASGAWARMHCPRTRRPPCRSGPGRARP